MIIKTKLGYSILVISSLLMFVSCASFKQMTPQELKEAEAAYAEGQSYESPWLKPENNAKAFNAYQKAANLGMPKAQVKIGDLYRYGQGVKKDLDEAIRWYKKAAEQDNIDAQIDLGVIYGGELGSNNNYKEALNWYQRAAEKGNAQAQYSLGQMFEHGQGVKLNWDEAINWYKKAANQDYFSAQNRLGDIYRLGLIVSQNDYEAYKWYYKAANNPICHAFGKKIDFSLKKDLFSLIVWDKDCYSAANSLGSMYLNGNGVQQDYQQAFRLFNYAAEAGNSMAQLNLGYVYDTGKGINKDYIQAIKWYRISAEQGEKIAQYNLGLMYQYGKGVLINYTEAFQWYKKSAEQEYKDAQRKLGDMYKYGLGVAPNSKEASKWYTKSSSYIWWNSLSLNLRGEGSGILQRFKLIDTPVGGVFYAVIFANKSYSNWKALKTPYADAEELSKVLKSKYNFNVKIIQDATREQILESLSSYRRLGDNDNLLIYFAGHGDIDQVTQKGYWIPSDGEPHLGSSHSNWVSSDDIVNEIKASPAKHILVIADSCFSGSIARGQGMQQDMGLYSEEYISRMLARKSRTVLTSGGNEPVDDNGGGGHSVFAKYLLVVLNENTKKVTVSDLFQDLSKLITINADQTPEYGELRNADHQKGDFILIPK